VEHSLHLAEVSRGPYGHLAPLCSRHALAREELDARRDRRERTSQVVRQDGDESFPEVPLLRQPLRLRMELGDELATFILSSAGAQCRPGGTEQRDARDRAHEDREDAGAREMGQDAFVCAPRALRGGHEQDRKIRPGLLSVERGAEAGETLRRQGFLGDQECRGTRGGFAQGVVEIGAYFTDDASAAQQVARDLRVPPGRREDEEPLL
jgi:hypothetical protein